MYSSKKIYNSGEITGIIFFWGGGVVYNWHIPTAKWDSIRIHLEFVSVKLR